MAKKPVHRNIEFLVSKEVGNRDIRFWPARAGRRRLYKNINRDEGKNGNTKKGKMVSLQMRTSISVSKSNSIASSLKHIAKLFSCRLKALMISQRSFVFTSICYLSFIAFGHFVINLRVVSHHSGLAVIIHLLLLAHGIGEISKRFLTLEPRILNDA